MSRCRKESESTFAFRRAPLKCLPNYRKRRSGPALRDFLVFYLDDISRSFAAIGVTRALGEEARQAVILAQHGGAQLQDGLCPLTSNLCPSGSVPVLLLALDAVIELAHQRLHQAAGYRQ